MDHTLLIHFTGDGKFNSITVRNSTIVPRIGDAIHNPEDVQYYYIVTAIDWFFNENYIHVVINAKEKNLLNKEKTLKQ